MVLPSFQTTAPDSNTISDKQVRLWLRAHWGVQTVVARKLHCSSELVRLVLYGRHQNWRIRRALIRRGADFLKREHAPIVRRAEGDGNV